MISQERFNQIEMEKGCGYWYECTDRACPCAITVENKGLTEEIWTGFKKAQKELIDSMDDFEWEPTPNMKRCEKCGVLVEEDELTNGMCDDCYL